MPDNWTREERTATHEAGHAVVAIACGRRVHFASIRPTEHYLGVARYADQKLSGNVPPPGTPAILWPASVRRWLETGIAIALAGGIAEEMISPGLSRRELIRLPDFKQAQVVATRLADISTREAALVRETEQDTHFVEDGESARMDAWILSGDQAETHLRYLEKVTRAFVGQHRDAIAVVAKELHAREVLSGRAIKQLVKQTSERREQ